MDLDTIQQRTDTAVLVDAYALAFLAQAFSPTDEGQTAVGEAILAIYAHIDGLIAASTQRLRAELAEVTGQRDDALDTIQALTGGEP